MNAIILEGVLFLALALVAVTLAVYLVSHYTAAGVRIEQHRNRRAIDRAESLTCAQHGAHAEREMVRLESGELMCPECYREVVGGSA